MSPNTSDSLKIEELPSSVTDQWLVRTAQNLIHGPYSKQEICQFIESGKLTTLDEVCSAGGYWFFLHEIAEVQKQLGVNPPLPAHHPDDEVTETEVVPANLSSLGEGEDDKDSENSGTTVLSTRASTFGTRTLSPAARAEREKAAAEAVNRAFKRSQELDDSDLPQWARKFETLSFWKTVTILLILVTAALFVSIIRLIRD